MGVPKEMDGNCDICKKDGVVERIPDQDPSGEADYLCEKCVKKHFPHWDGDYSYSCGRDYCRCMQ